jgi:DNA modification methylase
VTCHTKVRRIPGMSPSLWKTYGLNGNVFVNRGPQSFCSLNSRSRPRSLPSNLKQLRTEWIWEKSQGTGFLNCNKYPLKSHENILVFCDRTPPYYPQKTTGSKPYVANRDSGGRNSPNYREFGNTKTVNTDGSRFPTTVLKFKSDRGFHPTQKPVELLAYLIKTYTVPGAVILDCCCGSGSLAVAALNTDRQFICIEKDETYHAIASKRIADAHQVLIDLAS